MAKPTPALKAVKDHFAEKGFRTAYADKRKDGSYSLKFDAHAAGFPGGLFGHSSPEAANDYFEALSKAAENAPHRLR